MADFQFLQNPISKEWVILAPRRAKRPDVAKGFEPVCPFCVGREKDEKEIYRVGGQEGDSNWKIRVLPNKFPFAPIHELIIHSPDHHSNFDALSQQQNELIFQTYRARFLANQDKGNVYIFHNRAEAGGESLPHPHTQLTVIPKEIKMDIPRLDPSLRSGQDAFVGLAPKPFAIGSSTEEQEKQIQVQTEHFYIFCPKTSQWPDETWIAPKKRGRLFSEITDEEIKDLANIVPTLIKIFTLRHNNQFPFNFYIYPGGDWYLRIIPRLKSLGGFEIGTRVFINTQDPAETIKFISEHFPKPNEGKILQEHQADYKRHA